MDENLSRGYVQLGKARGINEFKLSTELNHVRPPVDRCNFVYLSLVLAGVGFLFPYNSFVIAVDYFQARFPGTMVVFDMSIVYISFAFLAVCANNILVETVSLNSRIAFGYYVSFITLNFIVISEMWWEVFGVANSYSVNLIAVAIVSVGCTVQQSSVYGYTSMLPSRYTQAVMAGESAASFWVSINRIITKSLIDDERGNTSLFFAFSIVIISICSMVYRLSRRTEFAQFYVDLCQERNKITLEPTEEFDITDPLDQAADTTKGQYGILKLQTSPLGPESNTDSTAFSFSNPVYEPNAPSGNPPGSAGPTYKVEDVVVMRGTYSRRGSKRWSKIKRGIMARIEVGKLISPYMVSICMAYFVTLNLYPGIMSEIISCKFESWMPVILMAAFNGADFLGKILASIPYEWTRTQLLYFSLSRIILIPLFLLCAIPRRAPILSGEGYPLLFSWLLGLTNGIVGSVPMIQAPSKVPEEHRELAGNIMTLSYTTGLTLGSLVAYMLDALLGPAVTTKDICYKVGKTVGNLTAGVLATGVVSSTLPTVKTTATAVTTLLTTVLMSNGTDFATTAIPKLAKINITTISNAIAQH